MKEKFENPAATVDLIVPYENGIVLIQRKRNPFKGYWALPGGFLNCGKENLEEAAVRELEEETHIIAKPEDLVLFGVNSEPNRDPRGHVISHQYVVKRYEGKPRADDDAANLRIFKTLPKRLAFDHEKILKDYFERYGGLK